MGEEDAFFRETVQMGGQHKGVAGATHEIRSLVVGENENHVGATVPSGCLYRGEPGKQSDRH